MSDNWPFDDPKNVAVFTTWRILREGWPILLVTHDEDDGAWQFLDGSPVDTEDAAIVGLAEIVQRDPTVRELAGLPLGWRAWRTAPDAPWHRGPDKS
jgi:hypothetical protein